MYKTFLFLITILLLGTGCIQGSSFVPVEVPEDAQKELWIVERALDDQIIYSPIAWFSGDEAVVEAQKDGCESACASGGFYWRYTDDDALSRVWTLQDALTPQVGLICNQEECNSSVDGFEVMSYASYLHVDALCRATPLDCPYYAIGSDMSFFEVAFSEEGDILQLLQWYVP